MSVLKSFSLRVISHKAFLFRLPYGNIEAYCDNEPTGQELGGNEMLKSKIAFAITILIIILCTYGCSNSTLKEAKISGMNVTPTSFQEYRLPLLRLYKGMALSQVDDEFIQYGIKNNDTADVKYLVFPLEKNRIGYAFFQESVEKQWSLVYLWIYSNEMVTQNDFCNTIKLGITEDELCKFDKQPYINDTFSSHISADSFLKEGNSVNMILNCTMPTSTEEQYYYITALQLSDYNTYDIINDEDLPENANKKLMNIN